jgi:KDO2-lipid IV(A) lauroyltransferase
VPGLSLDSTIEVRLAKPRNKLTDLLVYLAFRVVLMVMHCWAVEVNLYVARQLGSLMYAIDARHRRRALGNLARSFPASSDRWRRRVARRSMQSLFMLGVEVMFTTRLIRFASYARHVDLGEFRPTLRLMLSDHRGLILLTGHFGNWEVLGYTLATLGFQTTSVARPLDNPHLSRFVFEVRERQGQRIIAKKGATDEVTAVLDSGGMVGLVADQNAGPRGMFVDFFGRPASTYKSIGLLAMRYEVPIVIGCARRVDGAFRFRLITQDVIYPNEWADQPDALRYITQRYTRAIEEMVRDEPGQYLWVHRRWKTRPPGEPVRSDD